MSLCWVQVTGGLSSQRVVRPAFPVQGIEIFSSPKPTQWVILTLHWGPIGNPWPLVLQPGSYFPGSEVCLSTLRWLGHHQSAFSLHLILSFTLCKEEFFWPLSVLKQCALLSPSWPTMTGGGHTSTVPPARCPLPEAHPVLKPSDLIGV